jgi:hypothetical protein
MLTDGRKAHVISARNHGYLAMATEDNTAAEDNGPELQISMHALSGTSSKAKTFTLFVHIGRAKCLALIDSGSTTTFLDPSVLATLAFPVTNHAPVKVTVANGNTLWTQALCTDVKYTIQDQEFTSDFRVLELQGYDIILGCDWIYDHSPVGLNLKTREFTQTKNSPLQMKLYQTRISLSAIRK